MRIGKMSIDYESFYLTEVSRRCPNVRIEEYQTEFYKLGYDALISVDASTEEFPILANQAKQAIQRNEQIDYFESLCEIPNRAFYEIKVNDSNYTKHPIRYLQNITGACFPGRVIPMEAIQGRLCIYGTFDDEEVFNKCKGILEEEEEINLWTDECQSWAIDHENVFHSIPSIFDALGIDPKRTELLLKALMGSSIAVLQLGSDTTLLDILLSSDMLRNKIFLDILAYMGIFNIADILKEVFRRE